MVQKKSLIVLIDGIPEVDFSQHNARKFFTFSELEHFTKTGAETFYLEKILAKNQNNKEVVEKMAGRLHWFISGGGMAHVIAEHLFDVFNGDFDSNSFEKALSEMELTVLKREAGIRS